MQPPARFAQDESKPLRLLVEYAPTAIALLDCNLRYLITSRRWLIDYGLRGDLMGKSHYELLPELPERWKAAYQRCLLGAVEICEDLLTRPDGTTDWIRWEARSWHEGDQVGGLLIFSEVTTERQLMEKSLKQAYEVLAADGSERNAELTRANVILQAEVAECRQAMTALRDRNRLLQLVLDSLPQTIFWKDRNSVYQGCNQSFAEDAGVSTPEQIVGKTDYDLLWSEAEGETFREFDRRVMGNDQAELHVIEPPSVPNEQQGWVETSKIPLHDGQGNVVGILGTYEDITERAIEADILRQSEARLRKQAQQLEQALRELQQAQIQLLQSEKMSSLGQMVAGVAHEINNPINFIQGNLDHADQYIQNLLELVRLYQQEYPCPAYQIQDKAEEVELDFLQEDLSKLLSSMKIGAERICEIVKSLRTFSRLDEAEVKDVDIHEGIDSTLMILQNRLRATPQHSRIEIVKQYAVLPKVQCYAGPLNQVFMNILTNAIDALEIKTGGEEWVPAITISTEFLNFDASTRLSHNAAVAMQGDRVLIRIADNGSGMSEEVQRQLFDPFFTTKPVGKGTGLGMSISYQIVTERHQGSLRCVSKLGQGSEFLIEIPTQMGFS
jgi:two-component system, NtrC family, sensor kinase